MNKCTNVGLCEVLSERNLWFESEGKGGDARNVTA